MSYRERASLESRIASITAKAEALDDDELKAEVAKYLCILASGYLEAACRDIVERYVRVRAAVEVQRHVRERMRRFSNPGKDQILQLFSSFTPGLGGLIESRLSSELDAIGSIVGQRNVLAHGGNCGVSLAQIKDYFERACRLMRRVQTDYLS